MRILVTGGSGFLGKSISDFFSKNGHEIIIFDKCKPQNLLDNQSFVKGDLFDEKSLEQALKNVEIVLHFAAQADIDYSEENPEETLENNIQGTINLLKKVKDLNLKRFFFSSSVYVNSKHGSFYGVSKQCCEKIIEEYSRRYGLDFTILRYGSLYGPNANEFNSISSIIESALSTKSIERSGDGEEIREYVFINDAAEMTYETLSEDYKNKHVFISGNQQIKVKDLLVMINEILGGDIKISYKEKDNNQLHYGITPYSYKINSAKRIVLKNFTDLGDGLLQVIQGISDKE
ncbi:MAG: NAD-dependent epimerase [Gammaproteobacteria bacterium]|jgi:UDP-glucose 4-epimerase|nr:NAD-dependent epimerase [Gammaproteobacteria bacterium]|tara:strand:- start:2038 stop:2907 length:870 start_codon:yes stop_codon:yes gene_type:complete